MRAITKTRSYLWFNEWLHQCRRENILLKLKLIEGGAKLETHAQNADNEISFQRMQTHLWPVLFMCAHLSVSVAVCGSEDLSIWLTTTRITIPAETWAKEQRKCGRASVEYKIDAITLNGGSFEWSIVGASLSNLMTFIRHTIKVLNRTNINRLSFSSTPPAIVSMCA